MLKILASGNHPIAVIRGKEYETLKVSLANVINDVNSLVGDGEINVDDKTVKLEFYLGGDYKVSLFILRLTFPLYLRFPLTRTKQICFLTGPVLLISMGMKGATSNNFFILLIYLPHTMNRNYKG